MIQPLIGATLSTLVVLSLILLYLYERRRGERVLGGLRKHLDFWVLKLYHFVHVRLHTAGRYIIRQVMHYFLHTFLSGILGFLVGLERSVKTMLQSNKTLAKKSQHERTTRNKLEEIALHKMSVALSEEEKRHHKEKTLNGF